MPDVMRPSGDDADRNVPVIGVAMTTASMSPPRQFAKIGVGSPLQTAAIACRLFA